MESLIELLPKLTSTLRKGSCGKIAVIGGSFEYTGAPYFAAITALKLATIKSYSPSLIVYPGWKAEDVLSKIERAECIVMGSGMGRSEEAGTLAKAVFSYIAEHQMPAVYDGDAIFWACQSDFKFPKSKYVVFTPNRAEFDRMTKRFLGFETLNEENETALHDAVKKLVEQIGASILLKGHADYYMTVAKESGLCDFESGLRRCGGQGDMLAGALGVTLNWAMKSSKSEKSIAAACRASSYVVRTISKRAYEKIGRSADTPDMIQELPGLLRDVEKQ
ncbi:unnamed protein product, partial [Mesorhabditis spiculigera]